MAVAFEEITYFAPVEALASYRQVDNYVKRHGLPAKQVLILCLRDDLTALLQSSPHTMVIVGRSEMPELEAAVAAANEEIASLDHDWQTAMEDSDFLWAISWQWPAEYLLHLRASMRVAEQLLAMVPEGTTWLITPAGSMWGSGADQFGDRNPLWYLAIRANLERASRRYRVLGDMLGGQPLFFIGLLALRLLLNLILLVIVSLSNRLLGLVHSAVLRPRKTSPMSREILAFFYEPFSFASMPDTITALTQKSIGVHRVLYANLFRLRRQAWLSGLYALGKNMAAILIPKSRSHVIGRIDQRLRLSSWIFIHIEAIRQVGLNDYYRIAREGMQQAGFVKQLLEKLPWIAGKHYPILSLYTRLIILNYLAEYIFSAVSFLSLWRQARPRLVVYPDGYNMIIRLAQAGGKKYNYVTAQVPHGYPNRTFPQYYYQADHYLTPSQFSDLQLKDLGRNAQRIHWARHEPLEESISQGQSRVTTSNQALVIGLIYSGSYAYWSFPNLYRELFTMTQQLIHKIRTDMPTAQIILKSHPNGTSPYFFAALRNVFPEDFKVGTVTHISHGWAEPSDWQQLTAAVAPVIFPSTPTVQFITSGIPLLFIPAQHYTPPKNMYYPHQRAVPDYPFTMASVTEAINYLQGLARDRNRQQQARQTALTYAKKSSRPPEGVSAKSLAEVYAALIKL
jgi:hypothetical protein